MSKANDTMHFEFEKSGKDEHLSGNINNQEFEQYHSFKQQLDQEVEQQNRQVKQIDESLNFLDDNVDKGARPRAQLKSTQQTRQNSSKGIKASNDRSLANLNMISPAEVEDQEGFPVESQCASNQISNSKEPASLPVERKLKFDSELKFEQNVKPKNEGQPLAPKQLSTEQQNKEQQNKMEAQIVSLETKMTKKPKGTPAQQTPAQQTPASVEKVPPSKQEAKKLQQSVNAKQEKSAKRPRQEVNDENQCPNTDSCHMKQPAPKIQEMDIVLAKFDFHAQKVAEPSRRHLRVPLPKPDSLLAVPGGMPSALISFFVTCKILAAHSVTLLMINRMLTTGE